MTRRKLARTLPTWLVWVLLLASSYFPLLWLLGSSLKTNAQQLSIPPVWFPNPVTIGSWVTLFQDSRFSGTLVNSLIISVCSLALTFVLAIPAAYSFSRFRVGGRWLLALVMIVRLIPSTSLMIPFFVITRQIGLYDTRIALILVYVFFNLPVAIWFLLAYFSSVPIELEESARLDGCGRVGIILRIVVPLLSQGIAAVTILLLLQTWNEFPVALVLTARNAKTLPIMVYSFVTAQSISWGPMCAAGLFSALPIIILGIIVQKYLAKGLLSGAVKE